MIDGQLEFSLCPLEEIREDGSKGFVIDSKSGSKALLAVRKKGEVFVYINSCPHIGVPLDFVPGKFLDLNKEYILCSSHGALFRISDGYCISGPCLGKNLQPVASKIEGGQIILIL